MANASDNFISNRPPEVRGRQKTLICHFPQGQLNHARVSVTFAGTVCVREVEARQSCTPKKLTRHHRDFYVPEKVLKLRPGLIWKVLCSQGHKILFSSFAHTASCRWHVRRGGNPVGNLQALDQDGWGYLAWPTAHLRPSGAGRGVCAVLVGGYIVVIGGDKDLTQQVSRGARGTLRD